MRRVSRNVCVVMVFRFISAAPRMRRVSRNNKIQGVYADVVAAPRMRRVSRNKGEASWVYDYFNRRASHEARE